jgi:succinyl-diaminopimelate desuccinylase
MNDMEAQARAVVGYIEERRDELIELLRTMVRTRSVNPAFDPDSEGEAAMARLVKTHYDRLGIPVETYEAVPGRPNVVANWKGRGDGPKLLVNCHLDTHAPAVSEWVDPFTGEPLKEWSADPFAAEIRDGRVYGRGTADHKSPIAAILLAFEALKANGILLNGSVTCIHDADEETGGQNGMRFLSERIPFDFDMALYACTSEFTPMGRTFFSAMGTDNIIRSFSGWHTYCIEVQGQNLHTLTPKRGYGAVEAALELIASLEPFMERVNSFVDPLEGTGQPAMRISGIDCSRRAAFHHQARSCTITLNRRISPSVDPEGALAEIEEIIDRHNRLYPSNTATIELTRNLAPAVTPEDHPVVTGLADAVRKTLGREPSVVGLPSAVGISTLLNRIPIPTVLFGYGYVNLHHAIDEHIECEALVKTAKVYAVALMEWLGVEA